MLKKALSIFLEKPAFRFLPLLLCFLFFADIPWAVVHERFAKHGLMNNFFLASGLVLTFVFLADYGFRHGHSAEKIIRECIYLFLISISALILRLTLFDFESSDYVAALSKWYDYIKNKGGFAALKEGHFSDYNPTYLYIMAFLTYLPLHKLYAIKAVSVFFDYFAAAGAYFLLRKKFGRESFRALAGFSLVLLAPTILLNGSLWAQCDVIYSSFLLWAIYFYVYFSPVNPRKGALFCLLFFCLSFTFKLQAVFFVPVLFLLYVKGDLNLADGMMLPFVWFLSVFPNWLLGRDFLNLTLIYGHQVLNYPFLTLNAANIYQFLPQAPYEIFVKAGIVLTVLSCVIFGIFLFEKASKKSISDKLILTVALFSLIMIPFLLPKMHERYFFAADLVSIVWVFYFPRKFYVSIFIITASFCSYVPFLFNADLVPMFIPAILMLCALAETGFILHRIVRE